MPGPGATIFHFVDRLGIGGESAKFIQVNLIGNNFGTFDAQRFSVMSGLVCHHKVVSG